MAGRKEEVAVEVSAGEEEETAVEELAVKEQGQGMLELFVGAAVCVFDAAVEVVEAVMKSLFAMVAAVKTLIVMMAAVEVGEAEAEEPTFAPMAAVGGAAAPVAPRAYVVVAEELVVFEVVLAPVPVPVPAPVAAVVPEK